jgi:hypothetical protein
MDRLANVSSRGGAPVLPLALSLAATLFSAACGPSPADSHSRDGGVDLISAHEHTGPSAEHSSLTVERASVVADGQDFTAIKVQLYDVAGAPLAGATVQLNATGKGNQLSPPLTTDAHGVAEGRLASTVAETKTVSASVTTDGGALTLREMPTVQFVAAAPARLAFSVPPSSALAGHAIAPAVQVRVEDAHGNLAATATTQISIVLGALGPAQLSGDTSAAAVGGIATFANLSVDRAGNGNTLIASAAGLERAVSGGFDITAAAPAQLVFWKQPANTVAGAKMSPAVQVAVTDAFGNLDVSATDTITLAIGAHAGAGTLAGTLTVDAVGGVASFSDLSIDKVGSGYTLVATAKQKTGATSTSFDVTPANAAQLAFTTQPTASTAGARIAPAVQVTVQDALGNPIADATDAVTVELAANPTGAKLSGTLTRHAVAGVATFEDLSLDQARDDYVLVARAASLSPATSVKFPIAAAAAAKLAFTVQPSPAQAGKPVTPQVQVAVLDAFDNQISDAQDAITVALGANAGGATLAGTRTVKATHGVAGFADLSVDKVGSYTLSASSGTLASATSSAFDISAGAPARAHFVAQPSPVIAGDAIAPPVKVALLDGFGNPIANATASVRLDLGEGAGTAALSGVQQVAAVGGVATFDGLVIDKIGKYTLVATAAGYAGDTSNEFQVTARAAHRATVNVAPASLVADGAATATVTVTVRDEFDNPVASQTVTFGASGTANTLSASSASTDGNGTCAIKIASTFAEDKTITVAAGGLSASANVHFVAGAPAALAFVGQPANAIAGAAMGGVAVAVRDAKGNLVRGATNSVSLALESNANGARLSGGDALAAVDGTAAFAALSIDKAGKGYRLRATADGLAPALSSAFDIGFGAPAQLVFRRQPTNATAGELLSIVEVEVQDSLGNPTTNNADSITLVLQNNPAQGTLLGATTTAVGGVASFANLSIDRAGSGYTLVAVDGNLTSAASAPFDIAPGQPAKATSTLVADPASLVVGSASQLTVTVEDAHGNPVPNQSVGFSASGTANTFSPSSGVTDANGKLEVMLGSTKPEPKTVTAQIGSLLALTTTVTFLPGAAASLALAASRATVVASGSDSTTLTATVVDSFGNPVPKTPVAFAISGSGNQLAPTAGITDGDGRVTATLTSTRAEAKTVTVSAGSLQASTVITFVAGPPSASTSTLVASPTTLPADGVSQAKVTLTLADANGNAITAQPVSLAVAGKGAVLAPSGGVTDGGGVLVAALSSSGGGTKKVTAAAGSFTLSTEVKFTVAACAGTPLLPKVPWPYLGRPAEHIAVGDFNGDHLPDLVTANETGLGATLTSLSVLIARGHGLFEAPVHLTVGKMAPTGASPVHTGPLTVGDFNGDGHLDIAVVPETGFTVSVLFGVGDGTFGSRVDMQSNDVIWDIASGDFDHDGYADLAVLGAASTTTLHLFFGKPDGSFDTGPAPDLGANAAYYLASADVDGDGFADLVATGSGAGSAQLVYGIQDRTRIGGARATLQVGASGQSVTIGDFNGDGKKDLAFGHTNGVNVLLADGPRSFHKGPEITGIVGYLLASADLDGNGTADLVVTQFAGDDKVYLGSTSGTFTPVSSSPDVGGQTVIADFDGDGKPDLAMVDTDKVPIYLGHGDGTFAMPPRYSPSHSEWSLIVSGDFNGDQMLDLVSTGAAGQLQLSAGKGDGTFADAVMVATDAADERLLVSADFDGDGNLDLAAAAQSSSTVSLFYGDGRGKFAAAAAPLKILASVASLVSGDFDHDGKLDLAVASSAGGVTVFFGLGARAFAPAAVLATAPIDNPSYLDKLVAGDFNQDGYVDLAVADNNGVSAFYSSGQRSFSAPVNVFTGVATLASGDFNGDGASDLAVSSNGLNLFTAAGQSFRPAGVYRDAYWTRYVSGDFDNDGKIDLAGVDTNHQLADSMAWLRGNGDGTFQRALLYDAGGRDHLNLNSLVSGDFDNDGRLDFILADWFGVEVLLFSGCIN